MIEISQNINKGQSLDQTLLDDIFVFSLYLPVFYWEHLSFYNGEKLNKNCLKNHNLRLASHSICPYA